MAKEIEELEKKYNISPGNYLDGYNSDDLALEDQFYWHLNFIKNKYKYMDKMLNQNNKKLNRFQLMKFK